MLEIKGETLILQEFSDIHLNDPVYYGWLRDIDTVQNLYRIEYLMPMDKLKVDEYIKNMTLSENDCLFAIIDRESNEFIGTIKLGHINWRSGIGDVGIMIGNKKYRGRGISKLAISMICEYAFNVLSLRKLTAGTAANNLPMRKSLEKTGFTLEGVLRSQLLMAGNYVDHVLYGMLREEFMNNREEESI